MKTHFTQIDYLGFPLSIEYTHSQYYPQTMDSPEEPEEVYVNKIEIEGHNIYELVSEEHFKAIGMATLIKHRQDIAERPIHLAA